MFELCTSLYRASDTSTTTSVSKIVSRKNKIFPKHHNQSHIPSRYAKKTIINHLEKGMLTQCFLLLFYLNSIAPALVTHNHYSKTITYVQAALLKKVIHYNSTEQDSRHPKLLISEPIEKCWLCNHNSIPPQILFDKDSLFTKSTDNLQKYLGLYYRIGFAKPFFITTRGPPSLIVNSGLPYPNNNSRK